MNNRQKETLNLQLKSEQKTLDKLKKSYKQALDDINRQIATLLARTDTENLQSIIYQLQYQKALKTQISGILDVMEVEQFEIISDYLLKSYEDSFFATMYDLHGQGIPLIIPMDQRQVVKALTNDSKLSKNLYQSLGESTVKLKNNVQRNLSRGIAQGLSYMDIAKTIAREMVGDYEKFSGGAYYFASRIARTEGHRIQNQAALDAQHEAKNRGADIVKQWDSTLDGRVRTDHKMADGQLRGIDEPFDVGGEKLEAPGIGGSAKQVVHCRCVSLQRAKWALDAEELETLKERAEYYGLDKTESFVDFKKKYLKASQDSATVKTERTFKRLTEEEFKKIKQPITQAERKIIYGRTHFSGYVNSSNARKMNGLLREGKELPKEYRDIEITLSAVIGRHTLPDDIVVTRYVANDALEGMFGIVVPQYKLKQKIDDFWREIEAIPDKLSVGTSYVEKGFLSTSGVESKNVMSSKSVKMIIKAQKGTHAYVTTNYRESEIIFNEGTTLKIVNAYIENPRKAGWKIVLECEMG